MDYLQAADEGTLFWFENHHTPWLTALMKAMTFVGERDMMLTLILGSAIIYFLLKMPRTAAIVLMTALLAYLLANNVKRLVQRPRPEVAWRLITVPEDKSFPSGHALNSMADFATVALITSRRLRRHSLRWLVMGLGLGLPLLIGISRPYLGVHYPSDVIGGWTAGLACAFLALWADVRWGEHRSVVVPAPITTTAQLSQSPEANSEGVIAGGEVAGFTEPT
jgi:undecaprenyl-diphosphatase